MSDNGVPDLGGLNNEETFFADEVCQMIFPFCLLVCVGFVTNFARFHVFFKTMKVITGMVLLSQVQQTSLVYPGAYRKISVELKVTIFFPFCFNRCEFWIFFSN